MEVVALSIVAGFQLILFGGLVNANIQIAKIRQELAVHRAKWGENVDSG